MRPTQELVEAAKTGNSVAIQRLVERYEHAATVAAWTIVGDFHLAQDVAQESLLDALKHLCQLRQEAAFGPWLLTNVRRKANRARQRRPTESLGIELAEIAATSSNLAPTFSSEFEDVLSMFQALPDQEQDVVNLRYVSGFSIKQIATELNRPVGTVTKQISRAIRRLKLMLAEVDL